MDKSFLVTRTSTTLVEAADEEEAIELAILQADHDPLLDTEEWQAEPLEDDDDL
jgi:hypothetical protein